ncbi:hypothetical protein [Rhizobium sp. G21]|uniref:hypothetical protein n=1 Tax=Rhizobium sp. G21 TaxID=2758439 RepID=UPI001602ADDC|nr:hypothetical protein [Rhizobium sp. G21]MBB1247565.1 hypothetical protein [Rhizobium sp. G21]
MTEDRLGETLFYTLIFIWPALVTYACLTFLHGAWRKVCWLYLAFYLTIGVSEIYSFAILEDWQAAPFGIYFVPISVSAAMVIALAVNAANARTKPDIVPLGSSLVHAMLTGALFWIFTAAVVFTICGALFLTPNMRFGMVDLAAFLALAGAPLIMLPRQLARYEWIDTPKIARSIEKLPVDNAVLFGAGFLVSVEIGYFGVFSEWPGKAVYLVLISIGIAAATIGFAGRRMRSFSLASVGFGLTAGIVVLVCLAAYTADSFASQAEQVAMGKPYWLASRGRPLTSRWDMSFLTARAPPIPFAYNPDHNHASMTVQLENGYILYAWALRTQQFVRVDLR